MHILLCRNCVFNQKISFVREIDTVNCIRKSQLLSRIDFNCGAIATGASLQCFIVPRERRHCNVVIARKIGNAQQ